MTLLLGAGLVVVALVLAVFAGALLLASPASVAVLAVAVVAGVHLLRRRY
jgi:hypothetical protein